MSFVFTIYIHLLYEGFHKWWYPIKWMIEIMEKTIEMDDLGVPPFMKTSNI
jgi:hypothetical protein